MPTCFQDPTAIKQPITFPPSGCSVLSISSPSLISVCPEIQSLLQAGVLITLCSVTFAILQAHSLLRIPESVLADKAVLALGHCYSNYVLAALCDLRHAYVSSSN